MADAMDALRRAGRAPGRYAGIPVALKDLFDIAGEPTPAGSRVLADAPPAAAHAPVVQRMLAAGFVPVGRTNMTEFAFSGLGINPHYGTPLSPWDRAAGRIPGGSSSGTAVAVADGMAVAGLGTDTGGSCRIPAAFCGVVGYKPTARRVPITGVLPLAPSLDSVGPLAPSVACCAVIDAMLAGETPAPPVPRRSPGCGWRCRTTSCSTAWTRPSRRVRPCPVGAVARRRAHRPHRASRSSTRSRRSTPRAASPRPRPMPGTATLLAEKGEGYDPRIRVRIARGERMSAADYLDVLAARARLIASFDARTQRLRCAVMPTVPIVPPRIADLDDEREYNRINLLILRNTALGNFLDRCAISLPCHRDGRAAGRADADGRNAGRRAAVQHRRRGRGGAVAEHGHASSITCRVSTPVRVAQFVHDSEMVRARHRDQRARRMRRRALSVQIAAVRYQRRQLRRAIGDRQRLVHHRQAQWRQRRDLVIGQPQLLVQIRVAHRAQFEDARRSPGRQRRRG